jgi:hypothetical protein
MITRKVLWHQSKMKRKVCETSSAPPFPLPISIPGVFILNSKAGGGKSHLISYLFYELGYVRNQLAYGVAFSKTIHDPHNLYYIPMKYKYPHYDEQVLRNLMDIQSNIPKEKRPNAFVLFDDCISDRKQWNSPVLLDAITQCRHYHLWIVISTQAINKVPNPIREGAFQVAIFYTDTKRSLEAAYESYGQDFENFASFKNFLQQHTGDYRFLFKNKCKNSDNAWKVYRCPPHIPHFVLKY